MSCFEAVVTEVLAQCNLDFANEAAPIGAHWHAVRAATLHLADPCDRTFVAGFASDRVGTAFVAGYTEALGVLVGAPPALAAFAMTERGGGAPSAVHTTLTWKADGSARIVGEKTFVTLGAEAEHVYVVASEGHDPAGHNHLRLVRIARGAPGLAWSAGPALPIVPEVTHARVRLDVCVAAEHVFDGDAYLRFVKPFRTHEDIFVFTALCGHLLRMARAFGLPPLLQADLVATFAALRAVSHEPPLARVTHMALGGALHGFERLLTTHASALRSVPYDVYARFERDLGLRFVAANARAKRLEVAFSR